ncbi:alpha/beta fold hydrolase [Enterovibrio coralii]|uniref:AB hydrolase-1 domain-containing protein n=1 Tax=Enterovibrio coralii TaxID=294935 RepID=A0A135I8Y9_9GAMM|nr:alpha/beta hydrolase [Enterovibrio coralii]KXF81919.1 hypothetical protein ATN88_18300 [Enterovibrio coralii]
MSILSYSTIGSGPEYVVVLHEWLGDHSNYEPVITYLDTQKFTWIFVDLRGYGDSKELSGEYTCEEASEDVQRLIDKLGIHSVNLVGHSMSALVAQKILVDNPLLLKKLILVTPVPASGIQISETDADELRTSVFEHSKIRHLINLRTGKRYNSSWLDAKLMLATKASTPKARAGYLEMFLNTDFSSQLLGCSSPVRVIVGKHDIPAFQRETIKKLFSQWYKDLVIVECKESGHYPMLECPVFFASMLEKFVTES